MKIDFEARDDFGVAKAELVVTVKGETNSTSVTMPIPLNKNEAGAKLVRKQVELDLAKFNLKQDQELSYTIRVTDTKENPSISPISPISPKNEAAKTAPPQDSQKHLAAYAPPPKPKEPSDGAQPPPNTMPKRMLDVAGQCCSCQPMKIVVDRLGPLLRRPDARKNGNRHRPGFKVA